jgi:signal transduction histidine kinase
MSHELRTPLNAIQGHVQLLELGLHGPVTAPQREAFGRIDRAQRHLLGLINSILSYARLEGGRVEYDVREVRLADVVRDVLPMVEPQLLAKGLTLDVGLSDDAGGEPVRVWADQERLAQVLLNLLSNAVKFTAAGGRVAVTVGDRDDGSGPADVVFLRIADTGVGIPADKLEAVFEPFVQLRSSYVPGPSGTGLGLAISRDLARGMGGDLRARSVEGEGSTFTVTLRRVTTPAGEAADRRSGEERRADAERRVGDEPDASA